MTNLVCMIAGVCKFGLLGGVSDPCSAGAGHMGMRQRLFFERAE